MIPFQNVHNFIIPFGNISITKRNKWIIMLYSIGVYSIGERISCEFRWVDNDPPLPPVRYPK